MEQINKNYDAIIVGGGPSGCSCAHELIKSGKTVLMIDKSTFPRHKPCAGGITIKALKHLPFNIDHLVEGIKIGGVDAVLAASIFHFSEYSIQDAKKEMKSAGIEVRF